MKFSSMRTTVSWPSRTKSIWQRSQTIAWLTGAPSFTKMYLYPNFADNQVIANKSFFQADSVEYKWNSPGTTVLLLTQSDVDKTGGSYYGKQQLHYMSVKGDSGMVGLAK